MVCGGNGQLLNVCGQNKQSSVFHKRLWEMKGLVITCWGRCVLYVVVDTTVFLGDMDTRLNHHPAAFVGKGTGQYQARGGYGVGLTIFHCPLDLLHRSEELRQCVFVVEV